MMMSEMPLPDGSAVLEPAASEPTHSQAPEMPTKRDRALRCRYSATFEFETDKPLTVTGQAASGSVPPMLRQAYRALQQQYPGRTWTSMVVVLERL